MNILNQNHASYAERLKKLREDAARAPSQAGVYVHKNAQGEILYVGKAKDLRSRLKSYFTGLETHSLKTRALVEKIDHFEVILTENEYESLILENNLIKHHTPPYNILLRDDKTYPYIKIDKSEAWPRVVVTRRKKNDGALYFGPYTLPGHIFNLMNVINRFFPLVKCTPIVFKTVTRPCNYYDIKKCLGPCHLPVDKREYFSHLENIIDVLNGHVQKILKKIKQEMLLASQNTNFEKAGMLRDQMKALQSIQTHQAIVIDIPLSFDLLIPYYDSEIVTFSLSQVRDGKLVGNQNFAFKQIFVEPGEDNRSAAQEKVLTSFLWQYYAQRAPAPHVLVDGVQEFLSMQTKALIQTFLSETALKRQGDKAEAVSFESDMQAWCQKMKETFKITAKTKSQIDDVIKLTYKNAENKFHEQLKLSEGQQELMSELKQLLNLPNLPHHIECYDISTFQGSQTVASQVVFKDGEAQKKQYRKYIIRDLEGKQDDFAALKEVMRRRFKNTSLFPDLLIIDGGTPQVREVGLLLKSLGLEQIPFVGLAKARTQSEFTSETRETSAERFVVPERDAQSHLNLDVSFTTVPLPPRSGLLHLVTRIRDEAHRFAITFHRQKREHSSIRSVFAEVKGLGPKRKRTLLQHYPDVEKIINTPASEIFKITHIPVSVIVELQQKLNIIKMNGQ